MARELGLNPKKFGGLAVQKQEPWKSLLPNYIEDLYFKHFNKIKSRHCSVNRADDETRE